ncbi:MULTISPECIES: arabinosyltransferase domain-containing protein [unclassified Mycolicibacterium]|uniref:arabinosyltransferase domain-containing protein n=1 Tax=unclassified Mycolicibacterium TaxID=2636767 RepID=UPI0012DF93B4|nr:MULTISPECIES: arabinosyltransferase domain-containing protein [unclassified Mycolicibacterium]MUL80824.1 arabinosyltransferase [Mycolicibacterium sp. CBMA 329]MUL86590.1 arabinosyltransferase [Mycolicibacterium sp. CBMA 331]MUM02795.1 arabinosyltransferase [Mycolicibacterium sp. CBMA 334]MUM26287.1 arabinosyltransferase [Mycolicibacterium sp. CBMA 295]MUM36887.1 arabinosyltransferase [Mycolicibacterium sp. CBMA 247]
MLRNADAAISIGRVAKPEVTSGRPLRAGRLVAIVAGLVGFVASVLIPVLPVVQTTATLQWPQNGRLGSVTAPLITLTPVSLTVSVPCSVIRDMPTSGGLLLGTAPAAGKQAMLNGLFVTATVQRVDVIARNVVILSVPRTRMASPQCQRLEVSSSTAGTFAAVEGLTDPDTGEALRGGFSDPNLRPQIVGVFTDLTGPAPAGLSFSATIDTRYTSTPSPLKTAAMVAGIVGTIVGLLALWRLDRLDGRRRQRLIPARWRTFTVVDGTTIVISVFWFIAGAGSSDDGYQFGMANTSSHAGYMANYFRWYGSPEDPFGWYYDLIALMTHVSHASLWLRLPDLICALVCWLLLSREVLPRLGPAVVRNPAANWAAALVFLAAWMPFNNGLRPEGQIATGALITYVLVERAIIARRATPVGLAIIVAAFTLGIQPTGIIAVAVLLAGGRPIVRIIVTRAKAVGIWPILLPLAAAGVVVLTVIFADQTLAAVREATTVRTAIGPSQPWYTENLRYFYLFLPTTDGALSRRFGILITMACLFASMLLLLRRKRIPGLAVGPVWRLMGVIFATLFLLTFAPTKWIHHFGLFAAVGAAMAAVATVLFAPTVLRSPRNQMAFVSIVLLVLGLCFASTNGFWYVSSYGVPFNDSSPHWGPVPASTVFLALSLLTAGYAGWLHLAPPSRPPSRLTRALTAAPVPVAAGFMVVVCAGSMLFGAIKEYPSYSNGWANLRELAGGCGLGDDVLVEPDANTGLLTPLPGRYGQLGPLGGSDPVGFDPNGVPEHTLAEAIWQSQEKSGTDYDWDAPTASDHPGVNGSSVVLPYGLDPTRVPMAGSFTAGPQQVSTLTSGWYRLPAADAAHPLIVVTAAGTITGNSVLSGHTTAQTVALEYGAPGPDGTPLPSGRLSPYDIGPQPAWRNLRFPRTAIPTDARYVRIVAEDRSLNLGDWVAVTPPRLPELRSLQEYLGSTQPILLDWAVGLVFPCQQPMLHANGVTQIPIHRISPDYPAKIEMPDTWQSGDNGGPLGITDLLLRAHVMPTYLSQDWGRDWGSLRRFDPIVNAPEAHLDLGTATRTGLWNPAPIRIGP